ncbi:sulfotransferase family protein [Cohnella fermenti]|uniref:Sulfotransferase n=1 Tax=Cohnella fermenti TaxID=2565925 RepID=A0A4V3WDU8_9BACL|nr:sulfotransferase [Cohnella fermenti]THF73667.1 sulfotransferase [Cohnella fermenti]
MVGARGDNLVFLLCTPRSGSSLATAMLQNHGKLYAAQEMWLLLSLLELRSGRKRPYGGGAIVERFYNGTLPEGTFEDACRAFALEAYNGLLRGEEAELVLDKSPRYYGLLEFLDVLFPQSRRIWLVRNPFAVLASYKKLGAQRGGSSDLEALLTGRSFDPKAADLTVGLLRYMRYFAAEDPLAYRLRYERLVADPRGELDGVCRFLGLGYEAGMERYGAAMDTPKAARFFSMGVGDPLLADHSAPHEDSVHAWKELLTKREIAAYGRILGGRALDGLGYGEEREAAEKLAGCRFAADPDESLLALRTEQWAEATGWRWTEAYRMTSELPDGAKAARLPEEGQAAGATGTAAAAEAEQLRLVVRALEQRLESGHRERERLRAELGAMKRKAARLKAAIPFGDRLARLASSYISGAGGRK